MKINLSNKVFIIIVIILGFFQLTQQRENPIQHVIHLGMENHSFDVMFGFLEGIGELNEKKYCNTYDGQEYCTRKGADYQTTPDPPHSYTATGQEEFGTTKVPKDNSQTPDNSGFAETYKKLTGGNPQNVFDCYSEEQVPIMSTLAKNFKVCDRWFSSLPSCTIPNKLFYHAATSNGVLVNPRPSLSTLLNYPIVADTIEENMAKDGLTAEVHWMDWNEAWGISPMNLKQEFSVYDKNFTKFYSQLENGNLCNYTHLIPSIFWSNLGEGLTEEEDWEKGPNSQHPSEDIRNGELLIKRVYEALRKSEYWEKSVLIISYDESGGFYDHVPSPGNVSNPNPDKWKNSFGFEFTRLGGRIPALVISPWIGHEVDHTQYEHASLPHTLKEIFNLSSDYLTVRDKEANPLFTVDQLLEQPRQDCPLTLPEIPSMEKDKIRFIKEYKLQGSQKDMCLLIGQMLLSKGYFDAEFLDTIIEKQLENLEQVKQFLSEGQVILGLREAEEGFLFQFLEGYQEFRKEEEEMKVIFE
ncbi:hypothetical protein PPERSA_10995 [Pseudocohnilembus persalinus]|uniref:Phosphoesterase n=1 Tax=Pseudocohnilembus persalinus TaxID=266149 RepID=A0A0V0QCU7_PSEPJ|nr:hypothetical protein PPERSA_10995 [Pseudocohnilembus persalinus]|eukprot:KRW99876.1 hypothetical protein PPERSA_10995 [Pseudocohnilembus persalinus]